MCRRPSTQLHLEEQYHSPSYLPPTTHPQYPRSRTGHSLHPNTAQLPVPHFTRVQQPRRSSAVTKNRTYALGPSRHQSHNHSSLSLPSLHRIAVNLLRSTLHSASIKRNRTRAQSRPSRFNPFHSFIHRVRRGEHQILNWLDTVVDP